MKNCYLGIIDRTQILSSMEPAEIAADFVETGKKVNVTKKLENTVKDWRFWYLYLLLEFDTGFSLKRPFHFLPHLNV
jgi:hypothetical protein